MGVVFFPYPYYPVNGADLRQRGDLGPAQLRAALDFLDGERDDGYSGCFGAHTKKLLA